MRDSFSGFNPLYTSFLSRARAGLNRSLIALSLRENAAAAAAIVSGKKEIREGEDEKGLRERYSGNSCPTRSRRHQRLNLKTDDNAESGDTLCWGSSCLFKGEGKNVSAPSAAEAALLNTGGRSV